MYDLTQTTFLFSYFVNAGAQVTGTAPQIAAFLDLALDHGGKWSNGAQTFSVSGLLDKIGDQLIGQDWKVAWGPAVYQSRQDARADNAMAVLHSASQDLYVVAIAGTDPNDAYDWLKEDFPVGPNDMVDFPLADPAIPPVGHKADASRSQVSLGTARGLHHLLENLVDQDGNKASLIAYLQTLAPSGNGTPRIIFAGHSLGGALSAALPLQVLSMIEDWTWTGQGGVVNILPTAGPTPGNAVFAEAWGAAFPAAPVAGLNAGNQVSALNVPIANDKDLVPHAWTAIYATTPDSADPFYFFDFRPLAQTLQSLTVTIGPGLCDVVHHFATRAQTDGNGANAAVLPGRTWLPASFPISYFDKDTGTFSSYSLPTGEVIDPFTLLKVVGNVHVWGYFPFFGIKATDLPFPTAVEEGQSVFGKAQVIAPEAV
ncbi:hypothetical protein [Sphingomonas trueperi]|uniref:hypothetical protein n=1 Tax=Sphingomonas trueperi TaxID=53317 RepID=UPI000EAC31EC